MEVKQEINELCPTCNFGVVNNSNNSNSTNGTNGTNGTGNGTGPTNGTNGTNSTNSTLGFFNSGNYSVPSKCGMSIFGGDVSINCYESVLREVTYNFNELNNFYESNLLNETCSGAQLAYTQCLSNTVITDIDVCFRLSFYN